jgi:hypothetical protein
MALTQKSLTDIVTALNTGELKMDDLLAQLSTEKMYIRRGSSFAELKPDGVSFINGAPAKVFTADSNRIDRDGKEVERKPRKSNGAEG